MLAATLPLQRRDKKRQRNFAGEQMAKGHKDKVAVITGQTMNVDGGRVRT